MGENVNLDFVVPGSVTSMLLLASTSKWPVPCTVVLIAKQRMSTVLKYRSHEKFYDKYYSTKLVLEWSTR
jgi:hypothetical protein